MFPELLLYSIMVYLLILISSINTWDITSRLEIICIKHSLMKTCIYIQLRVYMLGLDYCERWKVVQSEWNPCLYPVMLSKN